MPHFETAQEWLTQSALLVQARPATTRITTKYTIIPAVQSTKSLKSTKPSRITKPPPPAPNTDPSAPRAKLLLKAVDSVTGVVLQYETSKAQEVGRLATACARMGREQARLPELEAMEVVDEVAERFESGIATPVPQSTAPVSGSGTGASKKKKKGKK